MTSPFKPGDRVVIVKSNVPYLVGLVAAVIAIHEYTGGDYEEGGWGDLLSPGTLLYELDYPSVTKPGLGIGYPATHLRKYEPDDRLPAEWTEDLERLCKGRVRA